MHYRIARVRGAAVAAMVLCATLAGASELSDDLAARRARVMDRVGSDAMVILWSAPTRNYSLDVDYEYRQDSNLYYLTGIMQEETILVLMPGNTAHREILFIKPQDPLREHWNGRVLTREEASVRTGIRQVLTSAQFEGFVEAVLNRQGFEGLDQNETATFFAAVEAGRAQLALLLPREPAADSRAAQFARRTLEQFPSMKTLDVTPILTNLRMVKTPYEQKVLVRSLEISSDAHKVGMRAARPGVYEYAVKAAIEGSYRASGAVSWSYPSIVASGPNATILHYPDEDRQMRPGDLLLVDAAANYQYMSGDITRTYPVDGVFTQAQKDLYAIVLSALEAGMTVARAGSTIAAIHARTVEVVKTGLLQLGLITDSSGDQYRMWYTHGGTHYIGIDVHDVGDRNRPLEPGMSFVIEPGIYIRQSAIDALPRTSENLALIERIQPAVNKYRDLGIRIEDAFLLESSGLRRLSASVPRTVEEIEAFMRTRSR
jgi:Xaa-Pro aminopeptidase